MKIALIFLLLSSSSIMAQENRDQALPTPVPVEATKRMTKKQLKAECKAQGLKGKELKDCIRQGHKK